MYLYTTLDNAFSHGLVSCFCSHGPNGPSSRSISFAYEGRHRQQDSFKYHSKVSRSQYEPTVASRSVRASLLPPRCLARCEHGVVSVKLEAHTIEPAYLAGSFHPWLSDLDTMLHLGRMAERHRRGGVSDSDRGGERARRREWDHAHADGRSKNTLLPNGEIIGSGVLLASCPEKKIRIEHVFDGWPGKNLTLRPFGELSHPIVSHSYASSLPFATSLATINLWLRVCSDKGQHPCSCSLSWLVAPISGRSRCCRQSTDLGPLQRKFSQQTRKLNVPILLWNGHGTVT